MSEFLKILAWVMGYLTEHIDYCMQGRPGHLSEKNEIALECGKEKAATTSVS